MTLDERLENVAVIGAAGKMGSGIVLLIAQEMAKLKIKNPDKDYHLYAMDISEKALDGLMSYLDVQATKAAEKACVQLRELYKDRKDLVENYDIIEQYTKDVLAVLRPTPGSVNSVSRSSGTRLSYCSINILLISFSCLALVG